MPEKRPAKTVTPDIQSRPPGSISAEEITGYLKAALQTVRIAYISRKTARVA